MQSTITIVFNFAMCYNVLNDKGAKMDYAIEILEREARRLNKRIEKLTLQNEENHNSRLRFRLSMNKAKKIEVINAIHKLKGEV